MFEKFTSTYYMQLLEVRIVRTTNLALCGHRVSEHRARLQNREDSERRLEADLVRHCAPEYATDAVEERADAAHQCLELVPCQGSGGGGELLIYRGSVQSRSGASDDHTPEQPELLCAQRLAHCEASTALDVDRSDGHRQYRLDILRNRLRHHLSTPK